jgi:hypothetical protein
LEPHDGRVIRVCAAANSKKKTAVDAGRLSLARRWPVVGVGVGGRWFCCITLN